MSQNHPSPHHHHNLSEQALQGIPVLGLRTMAAPKQRAKGPERDIPGPRYHPLPFYLDLYYHFPDP